MSGFWLRFRTMSAKLKLWDGVPVFEVSAQTPEKRKTPSKSRVFGVLITLDICLKQGQG